MFYNSLYNPELAKEESLFYLTQGIYIFKAEGGIGRNTGLSNLTKTIGSTY